MKKINFLFPIDGDVIMPADGKAVGDTVFVKVKLSADSEAELSVNGIPAEKKETLSDGKALYELELPFSAYRTSLTAEAVKNGERESAAISVFRFKNAYKKYRLAIDDIIWSMRELAEMQNVYSSIFDCPFFALFKRLNRDFGTCVQMNIYFTDMEGFNLTMMPDCYKNEFIENSNWLKLTFHAYADKPDRIYRHSPYSELFNDYKLVTDEIVRFAGEKSTATSANGLHWAETTREGARALRNHGINCLLGYYIFDENGDPHVAYYLNEEETKHCFDRDFWVDTKEDIIFSKDKIVIDAHSLDGIRPYLDYLRDERPTEAGIMNFVTHEQYFYKKYENYQPDYEEKIRTACAWARDNGYTPCFISDVIKEELPY